MYYHYLVCGDAAFSVSNEDRYHYGYNGKYKDNEWAGVGNHIDFGDRGYDPRTGRWPTPDKLYQKYPGISPYSYTAGNPIMNREIDGKDYDVAIDHTARTVTIKATYIVPKAGDVAANTIINDGTAFWNSQSGKFQYTVGSGDNAINYDVKFELTPAKLVYPNGGNTLPEPGQATSNLVLVMPDGAFDKIFPPTEDEVVGGANIRDKLYVPNRNVGNASTAAHEMGHGLGISHNHNGHSKMNTTGSGSSALIGDISKILGGAGIGENKSDKKIPEMGKAINITSKGTAPSDFENGKVKKVPEAK